MRRARKKPRPHKAPDLNRFPPAIEQGGFRLSCAWGLRRLIINADDFGLTAGVNRAIAEAHTCGVVSSATLIATPPAFWDAPQYITASPKLSVGCHISLPDGVPILPPHLVPTLLQDGTR